MTGPDINRPRPGSNGIGRFIIGVSPIGTIIPFDYWQTIISQYANSAILTTLIGNFDQYIDQTQNFDDFYDLIWNVASAQGYGLDVWGRIVVVERVLRVTNPGRFLGFAEATTLSAEPFGQAPWYSGAKLTDNFTLGDDAYRTLIYAKALANISDGSIPAINQLLRRLLPARGNCYVTDGQDMSMTYTFEFVLSPVEQSILENSGVLPTPTGVSYTIVQTI